MSISVQNFAQRGIGETLRTDIYKPVMFLRVSPLLRGMSVFSIFETHFASVEGIPTKETS